MQRLCDGAVAESGISHSQRRSILSRIIPLRAYYQFVSREDRLASARVLGRRAPLMLL